MRLINFLQGKKERKFPNDFRFNKVAESGGLIFLRSKISNKKI